MPNTTPKVPGDLVYEQMAQVKTDPIKQSVAVTKGYIYTKDAEGRLIVPVSTTSVADLTKGKMQAMESVSAPSAEDTDFVQVFRRGSRIILKADANLVEGQEVDLKSATSTTTQDKVMAGVSPHGKGHLGFIFEIYTKNTDGTKKQKTADNDYVIVEVD